MWSCWSNFQSVYLYMNQPDTKWKSHTILFVVQLWKGKKQDAYNEVITHPLVSWLRNCVIKRYLISVVLAWSILSTVFRGSPHCTRYKTDLFFEKKNALRNAFLFFNWQRYDKQFYVWWYYQKIIYGSEYGSRSGYFHSPHSSQP